MLVKNKEGKFWVNDDRRRRRRRRRWKILRSRAAPPAAGSQKLLKLYLILYCYMPKIHLKYKLSIILLFDLNGYFANYTSTEIYSYVILITFVY